MVRWGVAKKKNKGFYLPKEGGENIFKIRGTDNAILIFLDYFGYKGLHITVYVKEIDEKNKIFNIHITDEVNNKKIYDKSIKLNMVEFENDIQKDLLELNEVIINLVQDHVGKSKKVNNLLCLSCFVQDKLEYPQRIKNRVEASRFYSGILNKTIEFDIEELKKCVNCNNPEHDTYVDTNLTNLYMKNALGLFVFEDQLNFSKELLEIIKVKFQKEFDRLEGLFDEMKLVLESYKSSNN